MAHVLEKTHETVVAGKTVLSIDDDPNIAIILESVLGEKGYEVIPALDGKEGLLKAIKLKPHLITLDISMPEMDGWMVLKELKCLDEVRKIPVVILSIFDEKKLGYALGAFDYLVKPFDIDDLCSVVDRAEACNSLMEDV
jgi:DNA-binding response OmpR family regulator